MTKLKLKNKTKITLARTSTPQYNLPYGVPSITDSKDLWPKFF